MARPQRETCIQCGRHVDECGYLSSTYRCFDCGTGKSINQQRELAAHEGYEFKRWRARSIAALGVEVPDNLKPYLD